MSIEHMVETYNESDAPTYEALYEYLSEGADAAAGEEYHPLVAKLDNIDRHTAETPVLINDLTNLVARATEVLQLENVKLKQLKEVSEARLKALKAQVLLEADSAFTAAQGKGPTEKRLQALVDADPRILKMTEDVANEIAAIEANMATMQKDKTRIAGMLSAVMAKQNILPALQGMQNAIVRGGE